MRIFAIAADVLLAGLGLALFIYGDLLTDRTARIAGVVVVTLAVVTGSIIAATRQRD
jgi:hypothetical protein